MRTRTSANRLETLRERLVCAGDRELCRTRANLLRTREQLTLQRVQTRFDRERAALEAQGRVVRAHDPRRALARGYSLTYDASGTLLRSLRDATPGQIITTHLVDGRVASTVQEIEEDADGK